MEVVGEAGEMERSARSSSSGSPARGLRRLEGWKTAAGLVNMLSWEGGMSACSRCSVSITALRSSAGIHRSLLEGFVVLKEDQVASVVEELVRCRVSGLVAVEDLL